MRLFYSKQAKVMMYLAIPVILVTQYAKFNSFNIVIQSLVYMAIAYNAECMVEGGCGMWAWLSVSLPILYSLLYIFFGNQLGLVATPPSPITNIMPIHRSTSRPTTQDNTTTPIEEIVYVDEAGNVLSTETVPANSRIKGEPESGSGQPIPTTGDVAEAFSF